MGIAWMLLLKGSQNGLQRKQSINIKILRAMSTVRFDERPGYKIFKEDVCDKIFGKDVVKIKKDAPYNLITGKWTLPDDCLDFKKNFVKRLERLKMRFEKTASYPDLLKLVAQIADVSKCYKAWAKLAALDVMLNNYQMRGIELNKKVERRQTRTSRI